MRIAFSAFWLQKAGNQPEEYEDAYWPKPKSDMEVECSEFLCAIADGATETSFSGLWAEILVSAFAEKRLSTINPAAIQELSQGWQSQIVERTGEKQLSWYAEEKLSNGAYASLLGLHIKPDGEWSAVCVGDSCLFQLRAQRRVHAFPYTDPGQFNNRPILLSTNIASNSQVTGSPPPGTWEEGDCFLLMTDALAHYFLLDEHLKPKLILNTLDQEEFASIIKAARQARLCRNDDVTLLKVCIKPGVSSDGLA